MFHIKKTNTLVFKLQTKQSLFKYFLGNDKSYHNINTVYIAINYNRIQTTHAVIMYIADPCNKKAIKWIKQEN